MNSLANDYRWAEVIEKLSKDEQRELIELYEKTGVMSEESCQKYRKYLNLPKEEPVETDATHLHGDYRD